MICIYFGNHKGFWEEINYFLHKKMIQNCIQHLLICKILF